MQILGVNSRSQFIIHVIEGYGNLHPDTIIFDEALIKQFSSSWKNDIRYLLKCLQRKSKENPKVLGWSFGLGFWVGVLGWSFGLGFCVGNTKMMRFSSVVCGSIYAPNISGSAIVTPCKRIPFPHTEANIRTKKSFLLFY